MNAIANNVMAHRFRHHRFSNCKSKLGLLVWKRVVCFVVLQLLRFAYFHGEPSHMGNYSFKADENIEYDKGKTTIRLRQRLT